MAIIEKSEGAVPAAVSSHARANKGLILGAVALLLGAGILLLITGGDDRRGRVRARHVQPASEPTVSQAEFDKKLGRALKEEYRLRELEKQKEKPAIAAPTKSKKRFSRDFLRAALKQSKEKNTVASVLKDFEKEELARALRSRRSGKKAADAAFGIGATRAASGRDAASASGFALPDGVLPGLPGLAEQGGANRTVNASRPVTASALDNGDASIPAFPKGYAGSNATKYVAAPPGTVTLRAGSVIPAILQSDIISDYPGQFIARISGDVYDADKENVVIPVGSKIIGQSIRIRNVNEAISYRMGLAVTEIIRPDGLKIDLHDQTMLDAAGVGAVGGHTNRHMVAKILAPVAYASVFGQVTDYVLKATHVSGSGGNQSIGNRIDRAGQPENADSSGNGLNLSTTIQISSGSSSSNGGGIQDQVNAVVAKEFSRAFLGALKPIYQQYLGLRPTLNIDAGTKLNIMLTKDVYANPWSSVYAEYVK